MALWPQLHPIESDDQNLHIFRIFHQAVLAVCTVVVYFQLDDLRENTGVDFEKAAMAEF